MNRPVVFLALIALAACQPEAETFSGAVEGEYVYIAPTSAGLLETLSVARGQSVEKDTPLFALDATALRAALLAAEADVERERALWRDMTKGQRPAEIEVLLRRADQARADFDSAQKEFKRVETLVRTGAQSRADFDVKKAALDSATAHVAEVEAEIATAHLGGREDALSAALAAVQKAEQTVVQTRRLLQDSARTAPAAGYIEDTFYRPGEYVTAGAPVVSLLPPENVKIRFYVPESALTRFQVGQALRVHCDGCQAPVAAHVNYVASQSEYTPPVIYSVGTRDKLVFRIEAISDAPTSSLHPGQPVDIARALP